MKQFYVTLILVFCLQFGFGQIGFYPTVLAEEELGVNAPNSLFLVDIDGDGDLDLLSASSTDDEIFWYDSINGLGYFGLQQIIAVNESIYFDSLIFPADIDGDGDIDVLSYSSEGNKIAVYKNTDGQGSFSSQESISSTALGVESIYTADIDADGDLDIISKEEDYLVWYENLDGMGNFSESNIIVSTESSNGNIDVSDFDNDGDLDVISRSSLGQHVSWYENTDGLGDFTENNISNTLSYTSFKYWQVSDIDNDGDMDVLASSSDRIYLFENLDGQGNFESMLVSYVTSGFGKIVLSDIDDDGFEDIIIPTTDRLRWYKNLGEQNGFGDYEFITSPNNPTTELVVADADNDGNKDVFFVSRSDDKIGWFKNNNEQSEFWEFISISFSYIGNSNYATAKDLDGDGDLDILCAEEDLSWYENLDGQGRFGFKQIVGFNSAFAEAVDIDGDGDLDILSLTNQQGFIVWHENLDGLGNFGDQQVIDDVKSIAKNVKAADFDGDGDLDVVASSAGNSKVAWYENLDGLGDFSEAQILDWNSNSSRYVLPVDIDGDDDLDILIAKHNTLIWLENLDGQGNFGDLQSILSNLELIKDISAEDMDNDGDMDIIFSTNTEGGYQIQDSISWLENLDGQGSFGEQRFIVTSLGEDSFDIADMDNDGDLDVISSGSNYGTDMFMSWFENIDGMGNFNNTRLVIDSNNSNTFVNVADINGDGDMDVISGRFGKLSIYKNLGVLGNEINGTIQVDVNSDGCDELDAYYPNILVAANNESVSFGTFTLANGYYQIPVNSGNFTVTIGDNLPPYFTASPILYSFNYSGLGNVDTANFCLEPNQLINDINISIYPSINDPRPGFNTTYQIVYNNIGTTQLSGSVVFEFDESKLNFLNASETTASQTTNALNFDFTDLNPFETRTIDLEFNVFAPPTTNIDDILVSTATINPVSGDETEEDNVFTLEQTVIGSYDPNDITVLEGDEITIEEADKYLHYLIRFQNTGTASAINVSVEHILDDKLDWTTMQLESLSHVGRVEIMDETDVSFIFNNINLADSTNDEPNSHGYIAYKIKPKSNVEVGDIISGTADIFFDFNPPITTNTVNTEVVETLRIGEFNTQTIQLYPNPTNNKLVIASNKIIDRLAVIDINGRTLNEIELSNLEYSLDVSSLIKGVYFLEIQSGDTKMTKKFIKN
ncbi:T9SS type A sorting domain-containing protein [Winogradskyella sp. F6397]|uniref:T9SS type A sorting domain-containing protein n=1 Tax=Winogradskyella marina TaxID=2785530 RepID=A0ABS0EI63_9FLAO|nr:T9SS type A sorting domain-containing protein [Winogradskyella marina]MBF8149958.1 T9SS type A sorting domain-containing protein [Winogradskyella marina]